MKRLIIFALMLLGAVANAQTTFPIADTTTTKTRLKGQLNVFTLTQDASGQTWIVTTQKSYKFNTEATVVPNSRTLGFSGADGISITGGTQNLTANRTWTIGISSIDASKIGSGAVSNIEYSYLDGVTSAIQTQLNSISSNATHSNRSILDATTASYTTDDKTNLDANTSARHTHSNKTTLDNITAAYTTAEQSKLSALPTNSSLQASLDAKLNITDAVNFSYNKGLYNASTNSPTLTATPPDGFEQGAYYEVSTSGNLTFAGANFSSGKLVNVGDRLIKIGTSWTLSVYAESNRLKKIESIVSDYALQTGTTVTGGYMLNNGTISSSSIRSYTTLSINENDIYKVTTTIGGSPMYLVIYRNSSNAVIGYEQAGTNGINITYTDYYLNIPAGTTSIVINSMNGFAVEIKKGTIFNQSAKKSYVDSLILNLPYKSILSDYVKQSISIVNGSYYSSSGSVVTSSTRSYSIINATYTDSVLVTTSINGSALYLANYRNSSNTIIGQEVIGTDGITTTYTLRKLTIPNGTASIVINGMVATPIEVYKMQLISKAVSSSVTDALSSRIGANETNIAQHRATLSNWVIKTGINAVQNFYVNSSGTAVSNSFRNYKVLAATSTDSIRITAKIGGSPMYLAIYRNSSNTVIGTQFQGIDGVTTTYTKQKLTIPNGTANVILNYLNSDSLTIEKKELLSSVVTQDQYNTLSSILYPLAGKRVNFYGTSITAGANYAVNAPANLGGTGTNLGIGSSTARRSKADGSYNGLAWQNYVYSLSQTLAQKDSIINNWSTIRVDLVNSPPTTLDTAFVRNCSFERRLLPYLNGTYPMPDVFVFEHGRNDNFSSDSDAQFTTVPSTRNDRRTYIGAMNYLFDLIIQYNPYAKILILGHYENDLLTRVSTAQLVLADYWNIPVCRTWEKTGFSQQVVKGSQSLWSQAPWNAYTAGQNTSVDMVRQRVWLADGIHLESSGTNNKALKLMDTIVTQFLRENN